MPKRKPDTWRKRRGFMFAVVVFCMAVIVFVLWTGAETSAAETAVSMAFVIIGTTVASYVFGATWEDIRGVDARAEAQTDEAQWMNDGIGD